jgi:hypothetical protein
MKLHKSLYVISVLVLLSGLPLVASPQGRNNGRERWQYLGESRVDGRRDHDIIRVNARGGFRAIQLRVQSAGIEFQRVVVRFENGENSEVEVRDRIPAGGQTRAIDLPGDNRRIDAVEVWYGQANGGMWGNWGNWGRRRPTLRLYGLPGGANMDTNARQNNNGRERWEYLGQSNVDGMRDHDSIRVNARGAFRAIQLRVQGGEIEFQRVVVHFENGANSEVEVRDRIRAGGQSRDIDLPGDNRRIDSVEVWYAKGDWGRRRPNLRLYGRR